MKSVYDILGILGQICFNKACFVYVDIYVLLNCHCQLTFLGAAAQKCYDIRMTA